MGILWVRIFFFQVFHRSEIFSRGYFVGPKIFLVGILWVQSFFPLVFYESKKIFSRVFGASKYFLVDILLVGGEYISEE